ncbi:hypothetical protein FG386_002843 [Cryptosporidium ryanae]|uniref:uncharacterized protein n=1 Tax=Cryptosporidium ryanae TaxID=515981 RepID=UPI003519E468|nr:hypothetical protein FG386_002843 [Cryptosporidium ryanae]
MFGKNKLERHVHKKWPIAAFVKCENGVERVFVIDFSEGRTLQTISLNSANSGDNGSIAAAEKCDYLSLSIFWHDELPVLCICYNDQFEIWSPEHDKEYTKLLDEGLEAPNFECSVEEYYKQAYDLTNVSDQLFNSNDLFGINEKKRLSFLWEVRRKNFSLSLFKKVKVFSNENSNRKSVIFSAKWIDHDKLIFNSLYVEQTGNGTTNCGFISIWKTNIELFDLDIYNEIKSRRYDKLKSKYDFAETNSVKVEIITNIDSRPILNREFSFETGDSKNGVNLIMDDSERFIITYRKLDNELYIWRYEQISDGEKYSKNCNSGSNIMDIFSNLFQYQRISLKEKIISVDWRSNTIPADVKKNGGINDISIFTIISKLDSEIYVRIWRESSLDKPCVFFQSILLRFYDDLTGDDDLINVVWEDEFRNNVFKKALVSNFECLNSTDSHNQLFLGLKNNESYYYSPDRFKLFDEDDILNYYCYSSNDNLGENSNDKNYLSNIDGYSNFDTPTLNSFIPLNLCIHDKSRFMNNEKQEKELRIMVTIGKKYFYFKVFQLNVWNDQIHSSISKVDFDQNNNSLPCGKFEVLAFWRNNDFYYRSNRRVYEFLILTQDYDIAIYTLDEDNRKWYFSRYIASSVIPDRHFLKSSERTFNSVKNADEDTDLSKIQFGKSAIELYCMNKILLLTNKGELILINNNFKIEKKFYCMHVTSSNTGINEKMHANKNTLSCNYADNKVENIRDALDNELFSNLYENNADFDDIIELSKLNIDNILYISHPISRSYYSFILVVCGCGTGLRVIGLNGIKTVCLIRLELISVYIEPVILNVSTNSDEVDNITRKHEEILSYLFGNNENCYFDSGMLKYEVSKISKYRKSNDLDSIYVCVVRDYEANTSHLIFFKIKLMFKKNVSVSESNNVVIGITLLPPINGKNNQIKLKSDFEIVNMDSIDHQLIFISTRLNSNVAEKNSEVSDNQLCINICELVIFEFEIVGVKLINEIILSRSDYEENLKINILDYNILIYNTNKQVMICYSLLALNMLTNIDDNGANNAERLILKPFQKMEILNNNFDTCKTSFSSIFLYLDFDGTYKCIITYKNTDKVVVVYWNRSVCKWEFKFKDENKNCVKKGLINVQKLNLFDALLFFYNDKLLPDIYKKDKNKLDYEDSNNYSLYKISVLEDFIFSLNDRKQHFSKKLIKKIMRCDIYDNNCSENKSLPNLNLEPYNIIGKLNSDSDTEGEINQYHSRSSNYNVYKELNESLSELLFNGKERSKMSISEIEEYNIKRYIIKSKYFNNNNSNYILTSEDICWILLCDKDTIIDNMFGDLNKDRAKLIDWNEMKKKGLIYILADDSKFQEFIEKWIYKLYQKYIKIVAEKRKELLGSVDYSNTDSDKKNTNDIYHNEIMNIILIIYTCLDKLNIVSAIFKIIDQKNVFDFLLNFDYNNDELRKQAMKNGYYLIKQRKYYWSICFFILSNSFEEISNICIKYLNDPQLQMVILRLLINKRKNDEKSKDYVSIKNILNKQINDIWLLSLENKDPWLSIISLMNYHLLNYASNSNNESIGISVYNMFISISTPMFFFEICDKKKEILAFYHDNIKNGESVEFKNCKYSTEDLFYDNEDNNARVTNKNSFDLNYSFIHPEHLMLYHEYIKKKLVNSYQCNIQFKKYSEFRYIIEIVCYYIKRSMNLYHYLSWFYYLEENRNMFINSKYFIYYDSVIKSVIMKKIYDYVYYINLNYHLADGNIKKDNLLSWYKDLIRISSSKSIYGFIKADNYLAFNLISENNLIDIKCKISNIIIKLLELVNDGIIIGWENNSAFDLYNLRDIYIELILYHTLNVNILNSCNILNDIMNLYCLLNNNIKLIINNNNIRQLAKYENIMLLIWNRIYLLIIDIYNSNRDEYEVGITLIKIYVMSLLLQQCILRLDIGFNNNDNENGNKEDSYEIYNLMINISKFVIISNIVIQGVKKLMLNKSENDQNGNNNMTLLLLIINYYIDSNTMNNNSYNISQVLDNKIEFDDLEIYSIYIILLTISVKINQDIVSELKKEEVNIKVSNLYNYQYYLMQLMSFRISFIENTKLLLKKYYFNIQFLIWKEHILLFIPMIISYFKSELNSNGSDFVLFINMNKRKIVNNELFTYLLNNIWIRHNVNNILLTYILRNQDIISLYNSNSISNIYYNILRENENKNSTSETEDINVELSDQFSVNIIKNENEVKVIPINLDSCFNVENSVNIESNPHLLNVTIYENKTSTSVNNKTTRGTYISSFFIDDDVKNSDGGEIHQDSDLYLQDNNQELNKKLINKKKIETKRKYIDKTCYDKVKKGKSDIYFSWFIKSNQGSILDLLYNDYKLLVNCANYPCMPFLIDKSLNNLLLNSKLYYLHPNTFYKKAGTSNKNDHHSNLEDKVLSLTMSQDSLPSPKPLNNEDGNFQTSSCSSCSFVNINKGDNEIVVYENDILKSDNILSKMNNKKLKLELLFNSILLSKKLSKSRKCTCDGYCINDNDINNSDYGILSYISNKNPGKVDFCVNVREKIKSIFIRSENYVLNNNEHDLEFIQIYRDIPLNFSKIQNQLNVKAIIFGEHVQVRKRKIRQIIYPYWCHSFAFNNYNKLNNVGNNMSIPKPIIIKNSNDFGISNYDYYYSVNNKVLDGIMHSSVGITSSTSYVNNSNFGSDNNINSTTSGGNNNINASGTSSNAMNSTNSSSSSSNNNSNNNSKLLIGTINSVNWCPAKVNIILSTSNGYILIYKVNTNIDNHVNCYKHNFNRNVEINDLIDVENKIENNTSGKCTFNDELLEKEIKKTILMDSLYEENTNNFYYSSDKLPNTSEHESNSYYNHNRPFIPIIIFQSHKKESSWSNIIDHSCRYIVTHGNGIDDFYSKYINKVNNANNNIMTTGTFNLAEFMGENTPFNFSTSNINSKALSEEKNCFCIWDIWSKNTCQPELLLTSESTLIINCHNWKLPNTLILITVDGIVWFVSYKYGNHKLKPTSFKLPQKNIINSYHLKTHCGSNIKMKSKLTIVSSDGTILLYNISIKDNHKLSINPIIRYNLNLSTYNIGNPLNIINTGFSSSNHSNKSITNTIFISWNSLLIIDNLNNCKVIKLLPYSI